MTTSIVARGVAGALLISFAVPMAARADDTHAAQSDDPAKSCQQLIDETTARLSHMPEGVERMSAQKEVDNARADLAKGELVGCRSHIKNARAATRSK